MRSKFISKHHFAIKHWSDDPTRTFTLTHAAPTCGEIFFRKRSQHAQGGRRVSQGKGSVNVYKLFNHYLIHFYIHIIFILYCYFYIIIIILYSFKIMAPEIGRPARTIFERQCFL